MYALLALDWYARRTASRHPEVGQHLLLVLRDRRVPEVDVEEELLSACPVFLTVDLGESKNRLHLFVGHRFSAAREFAWPDRGQRRE